MKYKIGQQVKVKDMDCIDGDIGTVTKIDSNDFTYLVEGEKIIGWFPEDQLTLIKN